MEKNMDERKGHVGSACAIYLTADIMKFCQRI